MMALQDELKAVFGSIATAIGRLFKASGDKFKYSRELFMAAGLCVVMFAGYTGYRWFIVSRNQTAQKAFSEYQQDYQLALKENNPQEWDRVASLFEFGWKQYSSSSLAPYFLLMQSDIQLHQGNRDQAVATLSQAIKGLSNANMVAMLEIKRALIQLDSDDQAMSEAGLQELVRLARAPQSGTDQDYGNNPYRDMALFYLGRYYWVNNKIDEAQKTWQELVDMEWIDKSNQSPWVHEAKASLQQLNK